jgi:ribose transport system substrate-binding protein
LHLSKQSTRLRWLTLACLAVIAGVVISACGGSSNTNSATGSSTSNTTSTGSGSTKAAALVTLAQKQINQYSSVPTFTSPGPAVAASKLAGKKILVVANDQVAQELVSIWQGVQQAAKATKLNVSMYNAQDQPTNAIQGIDQGINEKVGAIILDGVDPQLVPTAVAKAHAAGIPIVTATLGLAKLNPAVFGASSPNYILTGELMADASIVATDGKGVTADAIDFTNPTVPLALAGIKKVFALCGGKCTIAKPVTIEPQDWPTKVAPQAQSMVKANPNVNVLFGVIDDTLGNFAAQGVREADATNVKVIAGQGSGPAPLATVKQGGVYYANPGQSAQWTGWGAIDQAMRAMLKMSAGNDVTPVRYFDANVLKNINVNDTTQLYGTAYIAGFEKLWGLK